MGIGGIGSAYGSPYIGGNYGSYPDSTGRNISNLRGVKPEGGSDAEGSFSVKPSVVRNPGESQVKKPGRESSPAECETCKNRKYQDGSDEMVSFKSPAHVSPQAAGAAVRAHEGEHVSNAYKKAAEGNGKVIQASVTIKTDICSECGRVYVSGGETRTQIKYNNEENPYQRDKKLGDSTILRGMNVDIPA